MIDVVTLDRPGTLAAADATLTAIKARDGELLQLAAHWADLHHPDSLPPAVDAREERRRRLDGDHPVGIGGTGTPPVLAGCLAELGVILETSAGGARHLVADALDLRHRLPRVWAQVAEGRVRAWKARQVAAATRGLPLEAMPEVDAGLVDLLPALAWSRFASVLEATVKRAAPGRSRADEEESAQRRFVAAGRSNEHGIATLIARGASLDVQTFLAAVRRIADVLGLDGDTDPLDVRRSKAVGILGQPARALALLTLHRDDPDDDGPAGSTPEVDDRVPDDRVPDDRVPDDRVPDEPGDRSLDLTPLATADRAALAELASTGPRVQLYVHLTESAVLGLDPCAVARVEGVGPVTASTVRAWLRRPDLRVTVRPVVVPGEAAAVDAYEIPWPVREAVRLRGPASVFPWAVRTARSMDLDHIEPWTSPARGGGSGQTRPDNLAPLTRSEHRLKTGGRWQTRSPAAGVQLWRTPHGWIHLVTGQGTYPLGRTAAATAIWRAAGPAPEPPYARPPSTRSLVEACLHDLTSRPVPLRT